MNTWIVFLLISFALLQFGLPQALINNGPLNQDTNQCWIQTHHRTNCGWPGIAKEVCETRGCCFNSAFATGRARERIYCFYPKDHKCYGIDPQKREECGYQGIGRDECEKTRGCCFDDRESGVSWCFKGKQLVN